MSVMGKLERGVQKLAHDVRKLAIYVRKLAIYVRKLADYMRKQAYDMKKSARGMNNSIYEIIKPGQVEGNLLKSNPFGITCTTEKMVKE